MTIAQQLKIKDFPFIIKDKNGDELYGEDTDGYWVKREYDANGNQIFRENSDGDWTKSEYDAYGNIISYETSEGVIKDYRPKTVEVTLQDIADKLGINLEQLRIKE